MFIHQFNNSNYFTFYSMGVLTNSAYNLHNTLMAMGPITVPGTEAAEQAANPTPQPQTPPNTPGSIPTASPLGQVPPSPSGDSSGKTIAVILCLFFIYPLGVILMYVLTKWKWWVKLLLTLPAILFVIAVAAAAVLIAINPAEQIQKAECMAKCQESPNVQSCVTQCIEMPVTSVTPAEDDTMYDAEQMMEDEDVEDEGSMEEATPAASSDPMMSF